jgi:hypothetical protein
LNDVDKGGGRIFRKLHAIFQEKTIECGCGGWFRVTVLGIPCRNCKQRRIGEKQKRQDSVRNKISKIISEKTLKNQ